MKCKILNSYAAVITTVIITAGHAFSQSGIRLNQIGFYPWAPKIAIVLSNADGPFSILDTDGHIVFSNKLKPAPAKSFGGKDVYIADFSALKRCGRFTLKLSNGERSDPFMISNNVNDDLARAVIKAYYFQRASTSLSEKYAGKWHRAKGHPDDQVLVHSSAAGGKRPVNTIISSSRGWYDAGDYNIYIVNSGITMGTMLSLYEDFPASMNGVKLNIPETGNGVPDLLNELLWNLRWMFTMQDPQDGGVYHKLTNAAFDAMIMPDKAMTPRYVVQKSTAATLDFAAVMAQSARIFRGYDKLLPGLADSCLKASVTAWKWASVNPRVYYDQDEMNKHYQPAISTGTYGDNNVSDERIWAAAELYVTTHDEEYSVAMKEGNINKPELTIPSWAQVKTLGYYSLLRNRYKLPPAGKALAQDISNGLIGLADSLVRVANANAYQTVITASKKNFVWGSNSVAANQGIALIQAYRLTNKKQYLSAALSNLDYLLGRNATGYSYVTGYGYKTPMHPHHRLSVADGVIDPVPGLLAGGPNPGMQDHIQLQSIVPDEAYTDDDRAYAVNEIAINWNAPLVYIVNALNAIEKSKSPGN